MKKIILIILIPFAVLSMEKSPQVPTPPEVLSDGICQACSAPNQYDMLHKSASEQVGSKRKRSEEDEKKLDERLKALEKDAELETIMYTHQQQFQGAVIDRLQRLHDSLQLTMARQLHEEQEKEKKRILFEVEVQGRLQKLEVSCKQIKSALGEMSDILKRLLNESSPRS